jgi:hypothetical protein
MLIEEMQERSKAIRERVDRIDSLLAEMSDMRMVSVPEAESITYRNGIRTSVVTDVLLREVLRLGIAAAIESREVEIVDLLAADRAICPACGGLGSPSGEGHGLICGNCIGTGLSPLNEPD